MNTVAIMQPTYLPWCGYLDMVDQADLFILLDTVPISRQSWQTRNRILGRDGNVVWLSIPNHAHKGQILKDVRLSLSYGWREKQQRSIRSAYGHLPYERSLDGIVNLIRYAQIWTLSDFTEVTLRELCRILGITTPISIASEYDLPQTDDPIQRIADLCEATGATEFLEPAGGRELFPEGSLPVPVRFHEYEPQPYEQNGGEFVSHLSVIDALARLGSEQTLDLVRAGRRTGIAA